jgi:hypothetical protein
MTETTSQPAQGDAADEPEGYQIYIRVPGNKDLSSQEVADVLMKFAALLANKEKDVDVELYTEYDDDGWEIVEPYRPAVAGNDVGAAQDTEDAGETRSAGVAPDAPVAEDAGAGGLGVTYARKGSGRSLIPAYVCHART